MKKLLFYTHCDGIYDQFIIPYIYFAYFTNDDCSFEIVTPNINPTLLNGAKYLHDQYNIDILIRKPKHNVKSSYLRFLEPPKTKCEYTYIGDIDLFITEDILKFHVNKLIENNMVFDNQIRISDREKRLTGLHFVKSDPYYNLVKDIQIKYINTSNLHQLGDEVVLYNVCNESGLIMPTYTEDIKLFNSNRPQHGIHISLNRKPFCPTSPISVKCNNEYKDSYLKLISDQKFINLLPYLDNRFINNLKIFNNYTLDPRVLECLYPNLK